MRLLSAAALPAATALPASAQSDRCSSYTEREPVVVYGSFGSADGAPRRLSRAFASGGFTPLAESARSGGLGFWLIPTGHCELIQVEANFTQWGALSAVDGRSADFWAAEIMVYRGVPEVTGGRTSVYPLLGGGIRLHQLQLSGAPDAGDRPPPSGFARVLHRGGHWRGPAETVFHLGIGAHHLAGSSPDRRFGLAIGARMGYVLGVGDNRWLKGQDTVIGPLVRTSGMYGRLLIGLSYRRRQAPASHPGGAAEPRPVPRREPRIRDGRPTRRIG